MKTIKITLILVTSLGLLTSFASSNKNKVITSETLEIENVFFINNTGTIDEGV